MHTRTACCCHLQFYGGPGTKIHTCCNEHTNGDGDYAALNHPMTQLLDSSGGYPPSWCGEWLRHRPHHSAGMQDAQQMAAILS